MNSITIITPTLQRPSLLRTCESVNYQIFAKWQHVVMVDCEPNIEMLKNIKHPRRIIIPCAVAHKNWGNTCRHNGWLQATGEYVMYLDDDNFLADDHVLKDLQIVTTPWALFPILRHGQHFYTDPPRSCHVDTANVIAKREIGRWPDGPEYTMDGIWIEALVKNYPYQAFPTFRPIIVMPSSGEGK